MWVTALLTSVLLHSADCQPGEPLLRPVLLHLGEKFSLRLHGARPAPDLLQVNEDHVEVEEKGKRSEETPISLGLTFHLLREVLEMARAEQMAQQAHSNRKMMDTFGK